MKVTTYRGLAKVASLLTFATVLLVANSCRTQQLRIHLDPSQGAITQDESLQVRVEVEGLEAVAEGDFPIFLEIQVTPPTVAEFPETGRLLWRRIERTEVDERGSYNFEATLVALKGGSFSLEALAGDYNCCSYNCTNNRGQTRRVQWCKIVGVGADCPGSATYTDCVCDTGRTINRACDPSSCNNVLTLCQ